MRTPPSETVVVRTPPYCHHNKKTLTDSGMYWDEKGTVREWFKTEHLLDLDKVKYICKVLNDIDDKYDSYNILSEPKERQKEKWDFANSLEDFNEKQYAIDWIRMQ